MYVNKTWKIHPPHISETYPPLSDIITSKHEYVYNKR